MVLQNQTNDTVNWTQTGGGANAGTPSQSGTLPPGGQTTITPVGKPPWTVTFSDSAGQQASSGPITNANATVTLNSNWTVSIS